MPWGGSHVSLPPSCGAPAATPGVLECHPSRQSRRSIDFSMVPYVSAKGPCRSPWDLPRLLSRFHQLPKCHLPSSRSKSLTCPFDWQVAKRIRSLLCQTPKLHPWLSRLCGREMEADQQWGVRVPTGRGAVTDRSARPREVPVGRGGARGLGLLSLGPPRVSWGLGSEQKHLGQMDVPSGFSVPGQSILCGSGCAAHPPPQSWTPAGAGSPTSKAGASL